MDLVQYMKDGVIAVTTYAFWVDLIDQMELALDLKAKHGYTDSAAWEQAQEVHPTPPIATFVRDGAPTEDNLGRHVGTETLLAKLIAGGGHNVQTGWMGVPNCNGWTIPNVTTADLIRIFAPGAPVIVAEHNLQLALQAFCEPAY